MKVYDCFTYNGEEDLLEIRLNILDPYVDVFVICEALQTFSGKLKPLYYLENKERFAKWSHKIITINPPSIETDDSFKRAGYQKDFIREGLGVLAKDEDIIFFGDLDEIWQHKRMFREEYAGLPDDKVFNLKQLNYSYYLNNRSSEEWVGTIVGRWSIIKTNTLNHWRATHSHELPNGGWHFTNMGGPEQIKKKLDSYDHQEFNTRDTKADLQRRIENGEDYVGRNYDWQGRPFEMWTDEVDLPKYVLDNKDKYKHLWK